jgi:ribosomal protein S12
LETWNLSEKEIVLSEGGQVKEMPWERWRIIYVETKERPVRKRE